MRTKVLIAGAAGRDFHNFNVVYRGRDEYDVVAFTATQIPDIDGRVYPALLAGELYPDGIPIRPEAELEELIREHEVDEVVFAYSDVTHEHVMHIGSRALAAGASFRLLSPHDTMITSSKPVVADLRRAHRARARARRRAGSPQLLREDGKRVAVLRHPMPYGDLTKQVVQRFAALRGPRRRRLHDRGARGVRAAHRRGQPRLRGHRLRGDPRGRRAGGGRDRLGRRQQRHAVHQAGRPHRRRRPAPARARAALPPGRDEPAHGGRLRREQGGQRRRRRESTPCSTRSGRTIPTRQVVLAASPFHVEGDASQIAGKRVLAIEDGPTLTHGEMTFGAAVLAAKANGAAELIDPRAVRGRLDRDDLRGVPARRCAAAGDGLRPEADGRPPRDDRALRSPTSS